MGTLLWSYLGWHRFPRELSSFEVRRFFSFSLADRHVLRRRFRSRARLGAAIQLGFVRMTGATLETFDHIPREVLAHTGRQLALSAPELATLRALYRRRPTLFEHQSWACAYAGLRWPEVADVTAVIATLVSDSAGTLDRHRLARAAREALFTRGCLIPRGRDIDDWVRRAIQRVELADRQRLDAAVPGAVRETWLPRLMREMTPGPMTVLEWLRRPPRKRSTKTLQEELTKLQALIALSPPTEQVGIPPERLRAYARRMRRRRPIKVQAIAEPRRTLEIAALLSVLAARQSDTVLRLIEMRIAKIWRWAHALAHPEPQPVVADDVVRVLAQAMDDPAVSDADFRANAQALLAPWARRARRPRNTRAAQVRERLARDRRRIRVLLKSLIPLRLQGGPGDSVIGALRELDASYREDWFWLYDSATAPVGHAWNELIRGSDRQAAFRAFEAATLWGVRLGLRNGSLWLPHAEQYGGQHRMLLPELRFCSATAFATSSL